MLEVEAILAASTFIFPYKIHVPMLVVWGSECVCVARGGVRGRSGGFGGGVLGGLFELDDDDATKCEVSARRPHKNQSKLMEVKQVKIPGIQHQGGTLPSFCEKGVSAPAPKITRKAPIAEGTVRGSCLR